ncbi:Uncharacterised protein [Klebsiella pneumoniae]|nr:Uncharacterised protein [Klebsiella pneumoniae]
MRSDFGCRTVIKSVINLTAFPANGVDTADILQQPDKFSVYHAAKTGGLRNHPDREGVMVAK